MAATLKTPADKLPLAVRKNVRDEWENKKPEYEAKIRTALGEEWNIELNPNLIYQYCSDTYRSRLGEVIAWYVDGFVENLQRFITSYGADGISELNSICSKHVLRLTPQDKTAFTYGGLTVEEGVLCLVFAQDSFAANVADVSQDFATALKRASSSSDGANPFNLVARNAVRQDYDPKSEDMRAAIGKLVDMAGLVLNPNFENNAAQLAKSPDQVEQGWDGRIGWITLAYFESLKTVLERQNFLGDDMQQEAFQDAVEKAEVRIQIIPEWEDGESRYSELKVDGGVLFIRTTTAMWGVNVDDAALGLLDVL